MPSIEELSGLLKWCKAATGPDRGINCAIATYLGWTRLAPPKDYDRPATSMWVSPDGREVSALPPNWTGSLDDITALIERQFPGQGHGYLPGYFGNGTWAGIIPDATGRVDLLKATVVQGQTPALALCAAFLTALIAQAQS